MVAPILIFGYGNIVRGDDALGPLLAERAEEWSLTQNMQQHIEVLVDFQLNPEHAYDLQNRRQVVFIDAAQGQSGAYVWQTLYAKSPALWTTHASSPAILLWYCQHLLQCHPPSALMLSLAGYCFEHNSHLSQAGRQSLEAGWQTLRQRILYAE